MNISIKYNVLHWKTIIAMTFRSYIHTQHKLFYYIIKAINNIPLLTSFNSLILLPPLPITHPAKL